MRGCLVMYEGALGITGNRRPHPLLRVMLFSWKMYCRRDGAESRMFFDVLEYWLGLTSPVYCLVLSVPVGAADVFALLCVPSRFSVLENLLYLCSRVWFFCADVRAEVKREAGANPAQSRCCESRRKAFAGKCHCCSAERAGRRQTKTSQKTCHIAH